jgi:hypothetical protein
MRNRGLEPKDDIEARALFDTEVGGATSAILRLLFAAHDVPREHRWARLGVLQHVLELGFATPLEAAHGAVHDVAELQLDEAWLNLWDDREKIDMALQALADAVAALRTSRQRLLRRETLIPLKTLALLNRKSKRKEI